MIIKIHSQKTTNIYQWTSNTFCNNQVEFKNHINDTQQNLTKKILLLKEHIKSLEAGHERLQNKRKENSIKFSG